MSHRSETAPPHVYLNHYAGQGGQWFHHRHGTKYISEPAYKQALENERDLWVKAIEHYFDATAVMDVEAYVAQFRSKAKRK